MDAADTSGDDGDLLYDLACECEALFDAQLAQANQPHSPPSHLSREYQQRFSIWAAHLGVFARRSQSLDARLRNHPDIQDLVARLLYILRRGLQQLVESSEIDGTGDASGISDNEQDRVGDSQNEALAVVETTLTRLNRLGVTIRQSSCNRLDIKVKRFAATLDLDPFAAASQAVVQTLYPDAHQSLKEHLGKTMTDRYASMLYKKYRGVNLGSRRSTRSSGALRTIGEGVEATAPHPVQGPGWVRDIAIAPKRPDDSSGLSQSDLSTVNSKLLRRALHETRNLEVPLERRKGTSSVQVSQGNYPRPPFQKEGNFVTCEFCTRPLDKRDMTETDWRRHIDEDLNPYACISESCPDGHPTHPTFADWFKHMVQDHGRRWHERAFLTSGWVCAICDDGDPESAFTGPETLHLHLTQAHGDQFDASRLSAISRQSRVERPRKWNKCLLCCFLVEEVKAPEAGLPKRRRVPLRRDRDKLRRTASTEHPEPRRRKLQDDTVGHSDESSDDSTSGTDGDSASRSAETMARHIASHLQVLMLLTIRLASLQEDQPSGSGDDINSESVDLGDSGDPSQALGPGGDADAWLDADLDTLDADHEAPEDMVDDALRDDPFVPDAEDVDFSGVHRQYDDLPLEEDEFLRGVIASGAYQSHRDKVLTHWIEQDEDESGPLYVGSGPKLDVLKKDPYSMPNADVRVDHVFDRPLDLSGAVPALGTRDPSCERGRPVINLVRPTPVPTPSPRPRHSFTDEAESGVLRVGRGVRSLI